jgi:hypothetical protein
MMIAKILHHMGNSAFPIRSVRSDAEKEKKKERGRSSSKSRRPTRDLKVRSPSPRSR